MQNYSLIQKFLHDVVLNKKFINKSLFELEKIIFLKNIGVTLPLELTITTLKFFD